MESEQRRPGAASRPRHFGETSGDDSDAAAFLAGELPSLDVGRLAEFLGTRPDLANLVQVAITKGAFETPLEPRTRDQRDKAWEQFELWASTRPVPIVVADVPTEQLAVVATAYLAWLASEVDAEDPAVYEPKHKTRRSVAGMKLSDFPEVVDQLADTTLDPTAVAAGSSRRLTWRCEDCGREWQGTVASRTAQKCDCQACAYSAMRSRRRMLAPVSAERLVAVRRTLVHHIEVQRHQKLNLDPADRIIAARRRQQPTRHAAAVMLPVLRRELAVVARGPERFGRAVPAKDRTLRVRLWIATWRARLLVAWAGGLRLSEATSISDDWVTTVDGFLVIQWPKTKLRPEGDIVSIPANTDHSLCPHRALADLLDLCAESGIDRHGQLLPAIRLTGSFVSSSPLKNVAHWYPVIASAASEEESGDRLVFHGLRHGIAAELREANVATDQIRRHLRHRSLHTTSIYGEERSVGFDNVPTRGLL